MTSRVHKEIKKKRWGDKHTKDFFFFFQEGEALKTLDRFFIA